LAEGTWWSSKEDKKKKPEINGGENKQTTSFTLPEKKNTKDVRGCRVLKGFKRERLEAGRDAAQ